jgi:hypothetical protein
MKCKLCKKEFISNRGSYFWVEGKLKSYCGNCSSKIEKMSNLPEVMIVPITMKNFLEVIKKKIYAHPITYGRKGGKNIAFYISAPKSAITHIAEVKTIIKEKQKKIYLLGKIKRLKYPILRGNYSAIQGTKNTTIKKINKAKFIQELK